MKTPSKPKTTNSTKKTKGGKNDSGKTGKVVPPLKQPGVPARPDLNS